MLTDAIACLVIQIAFGIVGANIVGNLSRQYNLGVLGNTIAGIIGGGLGGQVFALMLGGSGSLAGGLAAHLVALLTGGRDVIAANRGHTSIAIGFILAQIVGGSLGGALLTFLVGFSRGTISD